jgi:hypothetical protein
MRYLKEILTGVSVAIIIGLLSWVGYNTRNVSDVKEKYNDLRQQIERHDELFQQEIDKRVELEKELLIIKTQLQWQTQTSKN